VSTFGQGGRRRPRRWPRVVLAALLAAIVFLLGLALGKALEERPVPNGTVTTVRTVVTVTETATAAP
jgi:hypothetical protein